MMPQENDLHSLHNYPASLGDSQAVLIFHMMIFHVDIPPDIPHGGGYGGGGGVFPTMQAHAKFFLQETCL